MRARLVAGLRRFENVGAIDVAGFGAGFGLVRPVSYVTGVDRSTYLPLFFTGGPKNLGIALVIAFAQPSPTVVVAIVTYYVLQ